MPADAAPPPWLADLAAESECAGLIAAHPWSEAPLGAPLSWPLSLQVATQMCLSSRFPMLIAWGPELTMIYNDGYRAFLGANKHPGAIGAPVRQVWSEVWDDVAPLFDAVMRTGASTWDEHLPLSVERNGYVEETFFTFSYSPLHDGDRVAGVLDIAMETTDRVIADRRLETISSLAARLVAANDVTEICTDAVATLADLKDVPSAEIWLHAAGQLVPVATNDRHLADRAGAEGLDQVLDRDQLVVFDPDWVLGRPAQRCGVPIGEGASSGVLAVALNPARSFDAEYQRFVELVGRTISAALQNAYRRSEEVGRHQRVSETLQAAMVRPASDLPTVAARYRPATGGLSVGGDWYDVISLPNGLRGLLIGDCVGHGLDAATVMGQLRSVSRSLVLEGRSPTQVLAGMDRFAASLDGASCTTMACAIVDTWQPSITYACAGHPPPLLVRSGVGRWLDEGRSLPLAVRAEARPEATTSLERGDILVLYSDGLVERRGESIDVGLDRLRCAAERQWELNVQQLADALLSDLLHERPADDVALLVKVVR